jgi:hypothetical protein
MLPLDLLCVINIPRSHKSKFSHRPRTPRQHILLHSHWVEFLIHDLPNSFLTIHSTDNSWLPSLLHSIIMCSMKYTCRRCGSHSTNMSRLVMKPMVHIINHFPTFIFPGNKSICSTS